MPAPEIWGPPIWTFFHVLAEKINENEYERIIPYLINYIKRICTLLPCPECSIHATDFLSKVNVSNIPSKVEFKRMLFVFHNAVNLRKKKQIFDFNNLEQYSKHNIIQSYTNFIKVYHTKGNMNMINESFRRELILKEFNRWFMNNIKWFL